MDKIFENKHFPSVALLIFKCLFSATVDHNFEYSTKQYCYFPYTNSLNNFALAKLCQKLKRQNLPIFYFCYFYFVIDNRHLTLVINHFVHFF